MNVVPSDSIFMAMAARKSVFALDVDTVGNNVNSFDAHVGQRTPFLAANLS